MENDVHNKLKPHEGTYHSCFTSRRTATMSLPFLRAVLIWPKGQKSNLRTRCMVNTTYQTQQMFNKHIKCFIEHIKWFIKQCIKRFIKCIKQLFIKCIKQFIKGTKQFIKCIKRFIKGIKWYIKCIKQFIKCIKRFIKGTNDLSMH